MAELPNASTLEARFERKLASLSRKHRKELLQLLGTPPNPANVPESFWQKVEQETSEELIAILLLLFTSSAMLHQVSKEASQARGSAWAASRASEVARGFATHGRGFIDKLSPESTAAEAREQAEKAFNKERAKRIAITETTEAQQAGGSEGVQQATVALLAIWSHSGHRPARHSNAAKRPCPVCSPLEGLSEREAQAISPGVTIPAHPNCDCFWTYYDRATGETWPVGSPEPPILRSSDLRELKRAVRN